MRVCSLKLMTGEELIATVVSSNDFGDNGGRRWTIKKPLALRLVQAPNGPALVLTPWSPIQNEESEQVLFAHALVGQPVDVTDAARREYIRQTTGIELPPVSSAILKG